MGFDWEHVLDTDSENLADAYDDAASDARTRIIRELPQAHLPT